MTIYQPTPYPKAFYTSTFEVGLFSLLTGESFGDVIDAVIKTDRGWSPRWQATVTIAGDFDHSLYGYDYLRLNVRRMAGAAVPLSEWTKRWAGNVANYTTHGAGTMRPSDITDGVGQGTVTGQDAWGTPETMTLDLYISQVNRRLAQGTTEITLHSGEVVLQEIRRMDSTNLTITGCTTVTDLVKYVIDLADPTGIVETVGFLDPDIRLLFGDIVWRAGDSAWDVLNQWLTENNYPLYSVSAHRYRLVGPNGDEEAITPTFDVDWSLDFEITQEPPEKASSMIRRYSYADTSVTSISGWGPKGYRRGIVDEFTSGSTSPNGSTWSSGSIGSWQDRNYSTATVKRAAQLYPRPGMACSLRGTRADNAMLLGIIDSITWTFPEGIEDAKITHLTDGDSIIINQ